MACKTFRLYAFFVFPISNSCTTYNLFIGQNTKKYFRSVKSLPKRRLYMNIKFINSEQRRFFETNVEKLGIARDPYRLALVYALSLTENCRKHFNKCYNTSTRRICLDVLDSDWTTGTDMKVIHLGFCLFTARIPTVYSERDFENRFWEAYSYNPSELFCTSLAPYFFEAIKLRYSEYFDDED